MKNEFRKGSFFTYQTRLNQSDIEIVFLVGYSKAKAIKSERRVAMRIFLVGSYTYSKDNCFKGVAKETSDIDVLLTSDDLSGYKTWNTEEDKEEREFFLKEFENYSIEKGGNLDIFLDLFDIWYALYAYLRGKTRIIKSDIFTDVLNDTILPQAKEITKEELHFILSQPTFEERLKAIAPILSRPNFLRD